MPEPGADPNLSRIKRVALHAIVAGVVITGLKFTVFAFTNSVAVLSDALESIINIVAACVMLYSLWLSSQPADRQHPYGHGKAEFLAVGMEGWLILFAGLLIGIEAVRRFFTRPELTHLTPGLWALAGIGVLGAVLAGYVWLAGRRYECEPLVADGKHLMTDVASTVGVVFGLVLVRLTGWGWLDPVVAVIVAGLCFAISWRLLWKSIHGLMDRIDPEDDKLIRTILDSEKNSGYILGYHKVRHRHSGPFHWVDMHLQVAGDMNVADSHELASRIERRIETALGQANATAHVEPYEPAADTPKTPPGNPGSPLDNPGAGGIVDHEPL